ncbi:uncharacterized protein LOC121241983 [Juglans microcarpa x Juglans regia]|uniref:uncharacterized protein LOC121241983 n=1 Tax=Juglans microcarpa x Juglans regia TaxID=2249226 RepID=UPI001B7F6F34|nr:uncharacterized protein LOC121241983 [Juglans microcarpa x Juglans regia]
MKKTNGGAGEQVMILCKDGHCSSGKNRKLITTTTSTITTTSKNEKSGQDYYYNKADPMPKGQSGSGEHGEKQTFMVSGKPTSDEHRESTALEHFPDNTDIVDMDYSPAKRKPPIHN